MNAFRHAAAKHIDVEIEYGRKNLSLRIVDDGCGFDVSKVSEVPQRGHFGLAGLHERAERIHSQLEVSSRPGGGTAIELRVPASLAYGRARRAKGLTQ